MITALWDEQLAPPPEIDEIPTFVKISESFGGVLKFTLKTRSGCSYSFDWYVDGDKDALGGAFLCNTDSPSVSLPTDHEIGEHYYVYCVINCVDNISGERTQTVSPAVEIEVIGSTEDSNPADTPVPDPDDDSQSDSDTQPMPEQPPSATDPGGIHEDVSDGSDILKGEYYSKGAQALIATADAYVRRSSWVQYDDTRLVKRATGMTAVYRARRGIQPPELATQQNTELKLKTALLQ